ncbi:uncharacterized protein LACBIDRAFT_309891 [Laccaria bicolor S238N-H82]|uniref:Predicted protein n=1 Tax=Laccaria bicolor (strain S238N-H82 / ATCC MYA-4686) TaxID=486041 RepID=B0DTA6_LACBS|nr:uncharacterized protein LACBIDRAFT_309891 [Laccaria bicolor S238N-H82]EDR02242.1 predicted protein [Laccaria bicolor S238N-H82]|eukprot:XP_001887187.1 predicted protein [Laccaria bicolor S238N-H82]
MANWIDFLSLFATIAVVGGVVYGVIYIIEQVTTRIESTKENLKAKGLDISHTGVSVKTQKRFDREDYVDATQRGLVKVVNASSFRRGGASSDPTGSSPDISRPTKMDRQDSTSSVKSGSSGEEKKKKKGLFGSRK